MKIMFRKYVHTWRFETEGDHVQLADGIVVRTISVYPDVIIATLADVPCRISQGPDGAVWVSSSDHYLPTNSLLVFEREPRAAREEAIS